MTLTCRFVPGTSDQVVGRLSPRGRLVLHPVRPAGSTPSCTRKGHPT